MYPVREKPIFENRYDAGRQLAAKLKEYLEHKERPAARSLLTRKTAEKPIAVLAIPNGGAPVGLEVALALEADFDLMIARKIPLPYNPEAGFGAVADDGTVFLNEELVAREGLTREQIDYQVSKVRAEIKRRRLLYRQDRPPALVTDRTVIVTDDGLASGYTMLATVSSLRSRKPGEIIVAVPVTSAAALAEVEKVADKVVTVAVGSLPRFAVADFYKNWHDLNDDEVFKCLERWRIERFKSGTEPRRNQ